MLKIPKPFALKVNNVHKKNAKKYSLVSFILFLLAMAQKYNRFVSFSAAGLLKIN